MWREEKQQLATCCLPPAAAVSLQQAIYYLLLTWAAMEALSLPHCPPCHPPVHSQFDFC